MCKNGDCIANAWRCDGDHDCVDHSDEEGCPSRPPTTPFTCPYDKFQCGNGECIPLTWECDRFPDCFDGTDEHGCPSPTTCTTEQFTCQNGNCIPKTSRCDGITDCTDGSDEAMCGKFRDIAHFQGLRSLEKARKYSFESLYDQLGSTTLDQFQIVEYHFYGTTLLEYFWE